MALCFAIWISNYLSLSQLSLCCLCSRFGKTLLKNWVPKRPKLQWIKPKSHIPPGLSSTRTSSHHFYTTLPNLNKAMWMPFFVAAVSSTQEMSRKDSEYDMTAKRSHRHSASKYCTIAALLTLFVVISKKLLCECIRIPSGSWNLCVARF